MDNRTEQLADGVWRVEVLNHVNAYVLANDGAGDAEGLTVVDTATRGAGPKLVRSVRMLGFDPRGIRDVLLTHWHLDHCGSAARFATSSAATSVWVGAGDLGVLRGERPPQVLPAPDTTALGRLIARTGWTAPPPSPAQGLADGARHEAAGGVEVVHTPGHTLGHVAYLLPSRGVLLAGDALFNVGRLTRGPKAMCSALTQRPASLHRILDLPWDTIAFGHGPPAGAKVRDRIAALATR